MRLLVTGASSFTGFWFAKELASAGDDVWCTFTKKREEYVGVRAERVSKIVGMCHPLFECRFGDEAFVGLLESARCDLLCMHGADATLYKSPDFNVCAALGSNCNNLKDVLGRFKDCGGSHILFTGSVFEQDEGIGEPPLRAFSPYGISKSFTWQMLEYWCGRCDLGLAKFVIPNPFGPYEEARFTEYLMRTWSESRVAVVQTPRYVRDNIHVSLLSKAYAWFAGETKLNRSKRLAPSGYIENQGAFAMRFASEMRKRTNMACEVESARQTTFSEPLVRINGDLSIADKLDWDEERAWDDVASYYVSRLKPVSNEAEVRR